MYLECRFIFSFPVNKKKFWCQKILVVFFCKCFLSLNICKMGIHGRVCFDNWWSLGPHCALRLYFNCDIILMREVGTVSGLKSQHILEAMGLHCSFCQGCSTAEGLSGPGIRPQLCCCWALQCWAHRTTPLHSGPESSGQRRAVVMCRWEPLPTAWCLVWELVPGT